MSKFNWEKEIKREIERFEKIAKRLRDDNRFEHYASFLICSVILEELLDRSKKEKA